MAIYRRKKEKNFTIVDISLLSNKELSWKAKGLLIFMLSRPDDWEFTVRGLSYFGMDGIESVSSGIEELETKGYLVRKRIREKGRYGKMVYDIYEVPCQKKPIQDFPAQEKTEKNDPDLDMTELPSIDLDNIDVLNMDITSNPSIYPRQTIEVQIRKNIDYEITCERYSKRIIDDMVSVMVSAMMYRGEMMEIGKGKQYPAEYIRSALAKIGPMHIEQIMDSLERVKPNVTNIRAYLLATLVNAAETIDIGYEIGDY